MVFSIGYMHRVYVVVWFSGSILTSKKWLRLRLITVPFSNVIGVNSYEKSTSQIPSTLDCTDFTSCAAVGNSWLKIASATVTASALSIPSFKSTLTATVNW